MERLVCVIIGYVCGLLQTGYLYGKWKHIDIRQHGSGNAGTTNTLRTLGWKAGMITFLGDFLKCVLAVWIVHILYSQAYPEELALLSMYAGMGAVLGHNYPFYLKFKGGKGIAATAGIMFSLDWRLTALCLAAFILIVAVTRYVSLGSLVVSTIFLIWNIMMGQMGAYGLSQTSRLEFYGVSAVISIMAFWRHRANIVRLAQGRENKVGAKKQ